ncbi:hypothetical protein MNBD_GAMMA21-121 [hydrothermal vent metagenome]|uniref:TNase-like domain-containing protein n=1 Tax=hydrothermal vent metagenome TaxID=652676 RepID=A0A3B1A903_9ZZZZ
MFRKLFYLVLFCLMSTVNAELQTISGKAIKVLAGDLIVFQDEAKKKYTVRLEGIDAPEKGQEFGQRASQKLDSLLSLSDHQVEIVYEHKDRKGHLIATVYPHPKEKETISFNKILVEHGFAWAYRKYSMNYVNDEEAARKQKKGLWAKSDAMAPWDWRKQKK